MSGQYPKLPATTTFIKLNEKYFSIDLFNDNDRGDVPVRSTGERADKLAG
ncbi:MAG: hypothetical protein ACTHNZ_00215 [Trinickia sp.]